MRPEDSGIVDPQNKHILDVMRLIVWDTLNIWHEEFRRFRGEFEGWLTFVVEEMPHIDWRQELDKFITEWHGQNMVLTPESHDSIRACLEQCEQAIVESWREQSTPEEFDAILNAYPTYGPIRAIAAEAAAAVKSASNTSESLVPDAVLLANETSPSRDPLRDVLDQVLGKPIEAPPPQPDISPLITGWNEIAAERLKKIRQKERRVARMQRSWLTAVLLGLEAGFVAIGSSFDRTEQGRRVREAVMRNAMLHGTGTETATNVLGYGSAQLLVAALGGNLLGPIFSAAPKVLQLGLGLLGTGSAGAYAYQQGKAAIDAANKGDTEEAAKRAIDVLLAAGGLAYAGYRGFRAAQKARAIAEQLKRFQAPIAAKFRRKSNNEVNKTITAKEHELLRELFAGKSGAGLTREALEAAAELSRRALLNSQTSAEQRAKHLYRLSRIDEALKNL